MLIPFLQVALKIWIVPAHPGGLVRHVGGRAALPRRRWPWTNEEGEERARTWECGNNHPFPFFFCDCRAGDGRNHTMYIFTIDSANDLGFPSWNSDMDPYWNQGVMMTTMTTAILFKYFFSPLFGEDFQFDQHIFQMGGSTTNQFTTPIRHRYSKIFQGSGLSHQKRHGAKYPHWAKSRGPTWRFELLLVDWSRAILKLD